MNNLDKIYKKTRLNPIEFSKSYASHLTTLLAKLDHKQIANCIEELEEARNNGNTIFIIGNGGSASTASHVGNDFGLVVLKKSKKINQSYRALALTDNLSVISAIGNDSSFENIFLDQLKVHFRPRDKLIAISASGNSPNLVAACEWFKKQEGKVMGWLGFDGGELKKIVDIPVLVTTSKGEYAPVEDIHLVINHIIVTWMQYKIISEDAKI